MKMTKRNIGILAAAAIVTLVFLVMIWWWSNSSLEKFDEVESEDSAPAGIIYLFLAEWCPHCKNFKPEIPALEAAAADKRVQVKVIDIDLEENKPLVAKMGVNSFPTIKYEDPSGEVFTFSGSRNADSIMQFVENPN